MAGRPFAVIVFAAAGTRVYNEHDLVFAEEMARRASTAMHNAELFHTAKKERERAEEAAALRERLVAVVGHDLRQPLASIDIRLGLLRKRSKDPEFVEGLDGLRASSRRMSRMIEQILDFTRSRLGGGLELVFAPMDLREALTPIVDELRAAHPSATIQLQCPELRGAWDRDRLEQVFSNLIGNALAHGDPGKPVTVTAGAEALRVWVEVHNEGPPIPQELQSVLFNPFRRGERPEPEPGGARPGSLHLKRSGPPARRADRDSINRSRRNDVSSQSCRAKQSATPATREVTRERHRYSQAKMTLASSRFTAPWGCRPAMAAVVDRLFDVSDLVAWLANQMTSLHHRVRASKIR